MSLNIKIAKDIDKLENLIQLYIYRIIYPDKITETVFDGFKGDLITNLHTDIVKNLVNNFILWVDRYADINNIFNRKTFIPFRDNNLLETENKIYYPVTLDSQKD